MTQAIAAFKQQKAATQPDANALQGQVAEAQKQATEAQAAARQAQLESAATMMAVTLGIDTKTIPYVLKMADLSQVMGQDGKINGENSRFRTQSPVDDSDCRRYNSNAGMLFHGTVLIEIPVSETYRTK